MQYVLPPPGIFNSLVKYILNASFLSFRFRRFATAFYYNRTPFSKVAIPHFEPVSDFGMTVCGKIFTMANVIQGVERHDIRILNESKS
ncbi:hypothetical protein ACFLUU_10295 [Chloroflexota bacterium]